MTHLDHPVVADPPSAIPPSGARPAPPRARIPGGWRLVASGLLTASALLQLDASLQRWVTAHGSWTRQDRWIEDHLFRGENPVRGHCPVRRGSDGETHPQVTYPTMDGPHITASAPVTSRNSGARRGPSARRTAGTTASRSSGTLAPVGRVLGPAMRRSRQAGGRDGAAPRIPVAMSAASSTARATAAPPRVMAS